MITRANIYALMSACCVAGLLALPACSGDFNGPSAADKALEELQQKYDELTEKQIDEHVNWAAEDLEKIGDWEYEVHDLSYGSASELEATLNEFGKERWEVFWIESTSSGYLVILKRPSVSYLSKIPLSQLGRLIIGSPDTAE